MNSSCVYLAQTDTTVGFLSSDDKKLSSIKQRESTQKTLQVVDSFKTLNQYTRVPKKMRKLVRNSKRTTFIYPNGYAFRVVDKNSPHNLFIKKFKCLYSTSANITKQNFDEHYASKYSNIIIYNKGGFSQTISSSIVKLTNLKSKIIR